MSPRTVPPAPLDDRRMWRLLMARLHGDAGGSDELFLFGQAVRERLLDGNPVQVPEGSGCAECRRGEGGIGVAADPARVPYPPRADFGELTRRAVALACEGDLPPPYPSLLLLLRDYRPLVGSEERGASYKQLAAVAHLSGMTKPERVRWYRVAESVPLADSHAKRILDKLKGCRA